MNNHSDIQLEKIRSINCINNEIWERISPYILDGKMTVQVISSVLCDGCFLTFEKGEIIEEINFSGIFQPFQSVNIYKIEVPRGEMVDYRFVVEYLSMINDKGIALLNGWKDYFETVQVYLGKLERMIVSNLEIYEVIQDIFKTDNLRMMKLTPKGDTVIDGSIKFILKDSHSCLNSLRTYADFIHHFYDLSEVMLGCNEQAVHFFQVSDTICLCSSGYEYKKTWEDVYSVCDEEKGWALPSTEVMALIGLPDSDRWDEAREYFRKWGYQFAITGQPVRGGKWTDLENDNPTCQFGLVQMWNGLSKDPCWKLFVSKEKKCFAWPSAGKFNTHKFVTLCINASAYENCQIVDHVWRVVEPVEPVV